MSMIAGTVGVTNNPGLDFPATGVGLAKEMYDALRTNIYDAQGSDTAKYAALVGLAAIANTLAPVIVLHIQTNALVTVPSLGLLAPGGAGGPVTGAAAGTVS